MKEKVKEKKCTYERMYTQVQGKGLENENGENTIGLERCSLSYLQI